MSKWRWLLLQISRRLWFRATLIGLMGVAAAGFATLADRFVPDDWSFSIGVDSINSILSIIASSMLAVTTFSLSTLTAALGGATTNATPRATRLLMQDAVTQNVLSTFVGAFLFSVVSIVVLQTNAYGKQGRAVLFIVTIGVLVLIVTSLLRWIDRLIHLGRVGETSGRVEETTRKAIEARRATPFLGGRPQPDDADLPPAARPLRSHETGYVVYIDMATVEAVAKEHGARIDLAHLPGGFLYHDAPLAWISGGKALEEKAQNRLRAAFRVSPTRDYDQDPRFGIIVLSEIASRALSASVNDPGTAIDVIGRITRLLTLWSQGPERPEATEVEFPHVHVPPLRDEDLFADGFAPVARDGAAIIEVQTRLHKALSALAGMGGPSFRAAAWGQLRLANMYAEKSLPLEVEKESLRSLLPPAPFETSGSCSVLAGAAQAPVRNGAQGSVDFQDSEY